MKHPAKFLVVIAAGLLCAASAQAKVWTVDYGHSHIGFFGMQGTTRFEGSFKNFEANIDFDPNHPEAGNITATININGVTAGSSERDSYLPQPDWFNIAKFPQATFASTTIRKVSDNNFVADGTLTIKGVSKPVSLPFTLITEGDNSRAQGKLTLMRTDYGIGEHDWSNEDYVKFKVDVTVDITAK